MSSQTVSIYPIIKAFQMLPLKFKSLRELTWNPKNENQKRLIEDYFFKCNEDLDSIKEMKGEIKQKNSFEYEIYTKLELKEEWLNEGKKGKLDFESQFDDDEFTEEDFESQFDAAQFTEGYKVYSSSVHNNPIAQLVAKNGDLVYITVVDSVSDNMLDLLELPGKIFKNPELESIYSGVRIPMISLEQEIDYSWIVGMEINPSAYISEPGYISKADGKNQLRLNEKGAEAVVEFHDYILLGDFTEPKKILVIDQPFLIWFQRKGYQFPLFVGYIQQDAWKNPGEIKFS